ncbi:protein trapped in endoderm-1-like [Ptychodera flava]|uniref:protein trapped in endoderm-1-like n=1 Tax=Ptychodera flava TaxID=63121 RepID=UPI00396A5986
MAATIGNILAAFAICILLVGYVGNMLMIVAILAFNHLRTRSNALLLSLAASNLLFLVTVVPFFVVTYISDDWPYNHDYCVITANLSFILIGVSLFHMTAISMFRYFSIVFPSKKILRNKTSVFFMIVLSWAVPVVMPLATAVAHWASASYSPLYSGCVLMKNENPKLFNFMVICGFGLPCACTIAAYVRIYFAIKKFSQRVHLQSNQFVQAAEPENGNNDRSVEVHLSKFCGLIFIFFLILYGPFALLNLIDSDGSYPKEAYMICTTLFWASSSINPILYGLMSSHVRQAYRRIITPWKMPTPPVEILEPISQPDNNTSTPA